MVYCDIIMADASKIEIRKQMVRLAIKVSVSEAARRFGTSRLTVRKWRNRYQDEGVRGLAEPVSRPKTHPAQDTRGHRKADPGAS